MPKKILLNLIKAIFLLCATNTSSYSQVVLLMPKIPSNTFIADFPETVCSSAKELISLRKCRMELELFRINSLERYNQQIQEYRQNLNQISTNLERERREGHVGPKRHEKENRKIQKALHLTSGKGSAMKPYHEYQERYQQTSGWVVAEITQFERAQKVFRNKN
jgi:hypothetical protein